MPLTAKQEKFCLEYVVDLNATQAAIRAGYSENAAMEIGYENLRKPQIADFIAKLKQKSAEILEITHQDVLTRLKNWAESDITETIGLTPEEVKELPLEIRQLVTKYKHTSKTYKDGETPITEHVIELHFVSKEKAIDMINRHIGFYEADNNQKKTVFDMSKLSNEALSELMNASK